MPSSEPWLWIGRIAALLLSFASGWLLGRSAPDWRGDAEVVGGSGMTGCDDGPLIVHGRGFYAGAAGAGLCALAAILLAWLCWPMSEALAEAMQYDDEGVSLLFDYRLWLMLLVCAAGYVPSRLTDKGPVGPLE